MWRIQNEREEVGCGGSRMRGERWDVERSRMRGKRWDVEDPE